MQKLLRRGANMKKLILGILTILIVLTVHAWAEQVTTTDGVNFNVTNDVGFTDTLTNAQIMAKVNQTASVVAQDSQRYLADTEVAYSWAGVEQLAQNAVANMNQTNQVNGT